MRFSWDGVTKVYPQHIRHPHHTYGCAGDLRHDGSVLAGFAKGPRDGVMGEPLALGGTFSHLVGERKYRVPGVCNRAQLPASEKARGFTVSFALA